MAAWSSAARARHRRPGAPACAGRGRARPPGSGASRAGSSGSCVLGVLLAGRRRDERRRAASQHGPRPARPRARGPDRRERRAGGAALERGGGAEDPGARAGEARLRPRAVDRHHATWSSGRGRGEPAGSSTVGSACSSRSRPRLRGDARARGLAPGGAGRLAVADGCVPAPRDGRDSRRARHDLRPHGRPARDRRAGHDGLRRPAPDPRSARGRARRRATRSGSPPATLYPELADKSHGFVYLARKADPAKASALAKQEISGLGFYPEERRTYPQGTVASQVLGYAGVDNHGLAGLELQLDKPLSGTRRHGDDRQGSVRARDRRRQPDARARGAQRLPHDRSHDPGERRARPAPDGAEVGREERDRDRARPAHRRGARDGRRSRATTRTGSRACPRGSRRNHAVLDVYEPGSTFKLVTVAGVLSERLVSPSTAFTLPYSIRVADRIVHDAEKRGTERLTVGADPLALVERRRGHARREARQGAARVVDHAVRLRQPDRDRLPGREPGDRAAASTSGPARRSATSRSDRASA